MKTPINEIKAKLLLGIFTLLFAFNAQSKDTLKVAILMFNEVQIIDFAAPYEVFGHAGFEVFTVSTDGKPLTTVMGLDVTPTYSFDNMPDADAVLVPGGNVHHAMQDPKIQRWLKSQQTKAEHVLSVCTGSHILAEAGLLDGLSATTFHRAIDGLGRDYPKVNIQTDKRFVDNGQIITSAGLSSGIDASLHLVGKVLGLERAKTIAMHIEYDWDPKGGFVRANMADTRLPDNDYDWPEGVSFKRVSSYGDREYWQTTCKAHSVKSVDKLLDAYHQAMNKHDDWQLTSDKSADILSWKGLGDNQDWHHQLMVRQTDVDNEYMLSVNVKRKH